MVLLFEGGALPVGGLSHEPVWSLLEEPEVIVDVLSEEVIYYFLFLIDG